MEETLEKPAANGEKTGKDEETGRFLKGNNYGNGRPKGSISLMNRIRNYLEDHPDKLEELVQYYIENESHRALLLQMIDGRPPQKMDIEQKTQNLNIDITSEEALKIAEKYEEELKKLKT